MNHDIKSVGTSHKLASHTSFRLITPNNAFLKETNKCFGVQGTFDGQMGANNPDDPVRPSISAARLKAGFERKGHHHMGTSALQSHALPRIQGGTSQSRTVLTSKTTKPNILRATVYNDRVIHSILYNKFYAYSGY